ncbi:hypothetical protein U0070_011994 [Myodes glareolus]|uniref:Uncharacterized protein n=1 Tax=Myodes glareolus TaxID=447135 RepID=A0AAW0HR87_MYOGA
MTLFSDKPCQQSPLHYPFVITTLLETTCTGDGSKGLGFDEELCGLCVHLCRDVKIHCGFVFIHVHLSESVVNRMKDSSQPSAGQQPAPGPAPALTVPVPTTPTPTTPVPSMPVPIAPPPSRGPQEGAFKAPQTDSKVPRTESGGGHQPSAVKEDLKKFQQEQAAVQDELVKVAKKEKEAAEKHLKASLPKKWTSPNREQQQSARLSTGAVT